MDTDDLLEELRAFVEEVQEQMRASTSKGEESNLALTLKTLADKRRILNPFGYKDRWIIVSQERTLKTLEDAFNSRKKKLDLEKQIWRRYIEKMSGTEFERATVGDLLLGICKKAEVPLYDNQGKVLWPD